MYIICIQVSVYCDHEGVSAHIWVNEQYSSLYGPLTHWGAHRRPASPHVNRWAPDPQ